jgi:LPS export ABC transporter permease LptG/LPS export ABC transporter permease LptF
MGILGRTVLAEISTGAVLGVVLFSFVLFLRNVTRLFELLVRSSASLDVIARLFLLMLPPVLTFTIPIGVLVGVLIALSRMSADAEIIALRASGLPSRRLTFPVLLAAGAGLLLAAACSLWLNPLAVRETYKIFNRLAAEQLTAEIQPRIFEEQFPNRILYVGDVIPGPVVQWRHVFLADVAPPEQRGPSSHELADAPRITVAAQAIAVADSRLNRLQLSLTGVSTYAVGKNPGEYFTTFAPRGEQTLEAQKRDELRPRSFAEMDIGPLYRAMRSAAGLARIESALEFHQRLALPFACPLLALIGMPLGISSRKGSKSSALVIAVVVALLYWTALVSLVGLARQQTLPVPLAVWTPNAALAVFVLLGLLRLERPGDGDVIASLSALLGRVSSLARRLATPRFPSLAAPRLPSFPQIIDVWLLSSFLFYFAILMASFIAMAHVFTFFELLSDIVKRSIPMATVLRYHFFLTPKLIYDSTPPSVLVAVLVTCGVLARNNEATALKACGVSLYRVAVPLLFAGALFSALLFLFDHYYVPDANRIQDAIRNQIKGRPVQTFLQPNRKWIFGKGPRIYYYKYLDPAESLMLEAHIYDLDPVAFRLVRHIFASRARWERTLNTWIFQDGWVREFRDAREVRYASFAGATATFPELQESPSYLLQELKQDKQMNFRELAAYIRELQQSGFNTIRLQVQLHKKFAIPLFALIMVLLSTPFAFLAGSRGAMASVGMSFSIAIAYWAVTQLFEQVGNLNQLPPAVAAWAPDALFSLAGLYLFARMRT